MNRPAILSSLVVALLVWSGSPATAEEAVRPATARVLVIRGVFNIFSTGLDDLGQQLRAQGYDVEMSSPAGSWAGAMRLREAYERDPRGGPLVIIGHSMGGRACLHISRYLQSYGIPVKLVVIVDANPWVTVPDNVERCVNLYVTNPFGVFHGSPVYGAAANTEPPNASSRVVNIDVTKVPRPAWAEEVNHFDIDNSPWMRQVILNEIAQAYQPWRNQRGLSSPGFVGTPVTTWSVGTAPPPPPDPPRATQTDRPPQTLRFRL